MMRIERQASDKIEKEITEQREQFNLPMDSYQLKIIKKALDLYGRGIDDEAHKLTLEMMDVSAADIRGKKLNHTKVKKLSEKYYVAKSEDNEINTIIDAIETHESEIQAEEERQEELAELGVQMKELEERKKELV